MHMIAWIVSGTLAGAIVGRVLRGGGYGISGSLVIGSAGGIIGGWLFHHVLRLTSEGALAVHFFASLLGGAALVVAVRALDRAARYTVTRDHPPSTAGELETRLHKLGEIERQVYGKLFARKPVASDANAEFDAESTFGQRVADQVARFGGSWTFIGLFGLLMTIWMIANVNEKKPLDPFPFVLLNLMLSCLAALQAPVIMMSQNRQAAKDRLAAENDYRVNLNSETQILALHEKFDALLAVRLQQLAELEERHAALLREIAARGIAPNDRPT